MLLKDAATKTVESHARLVGEAGIENVRPGDADVLAAVDGKAPIARQARECCERIERIETIFVENGVVSRNSIVGPELVVDLHRAQVNRIADDGRGNERCRCRGVSYVGCRKQIED